MELGRDLARPKVEERGKMASKVRSLALIMAVSIFHAAIAPAVMASTVTMDTLAVSLEKARVARGFKEARAIPTIGGMIDSLGAAGNPASAKAWDAFLKRARISRAEANPISKVAEGVDGVELFIRGQRKPFAINVEVREGLIIHKVNGKPLSSDSRSTPAEVYENFIKSQGSPAHAWIYDVLVPSASAMGPVEIAVVAFLLATAGVIAAGRASGVIPATTVQMYFDEATATCEKEMGTFRLPYENSSTSKTIGALESIVKKENLSDVEGCARYVGTIELKESKIQASGDHAMACKAAVRFFGCRDKFEAKSRRSRQSGPERDSATGMEVR